MPRIPYWNIEAGWFIDLLALPAVAVLLYGLYRHWLAIRQGRVVVRFVEPWSTVNLRRARLRNLLVGGLLAGRVYRKPFTGLAHGLLFWGMATLALGTALVLANVLLDAPIFVGDFNRWFMAFGLDLAGLAALLGVCLLLARRLVGLPRLNQPKARPGFVTVELILVAVLATGFFVEGLRLSLRGPEDGAFVGNLVAAWLGPGQNAASLHTSLWWLHGLMALGLMAYLPFSPLVHLVLVPVNAALANPRPGLKMGVVDFQAFEEASGQEQPPTLGTPTLKDFNRKRLLDFDTCLWCGRCQEVCPANATGKALSPKGVMVTLAEHLAAGRLEDGSLIERVGEEAIFQCLTCAACLEACPSFTNPAKAVLSMRQHLVMEKSQLPATMAQAHKSLEARQHPFFGTASSAKDWRKGLEVPFFTPGQSEYLLWVGCAATFEERAQKVARAVVQLLNQAGVSYGILEEHRCTGDPAKQMGDEFLFRMVAEDNIARLAELGVKKIITLCPHCFNALRNYYSHLGGHYQLMPHPVLLASLLKQGRLKVRRSQQLLAYHDPCYLGRRNLVLDEPRRVVSAIGRLTEMPRHGRKSFCCGAGGGNYWSEETGARINQTRAREALDTGASRLVTSCPFCLLMLTDGAKKFKEEPVVFDLAELLLAELESGTGAPSGTGQAA